MMKPNSKTVAICGLFCGTCSYFPKECHGCLSDKLTAHCVFCPNGFRDCAKEHQVTRCYECSEFPCSRLENFSKQHWQNRICHHASVISDLEAMKTIGVDEFVNQKTKENTCQECGKLILWFEKESHKCKKV